MKLDASCYNGTRFVLFQDDTSGSLDSTNISNPILAENDYIYHKDAFGSWFEKNTTDGNVTYKEIYYYDDNNDDKFDMYGKYITYENMEVSYIYSFNNDGNLEDKRYVFEVLDAQNNISKSLEQFDYDNNGFFDAKKAYEYTYNLDGSKEITVYQDDDIDNHNEHIIDYKIDAQGRRVSVAHKLDNNKDGNFEYLENGKEYENYQKISQKIDEDYDGIYDVERLEARDYIGNCLYKREINKEIGDFSQGGIGDCWYLSGLGAFSNTEQGSQILKDAITINEDDTYTVNFAGIEKEITISQQDLMRYDDSFSRGDGDALLFEIAAEALFQNNLGMQFEVKESSWSNKDTIYASYMKDRDDSINGGYYKEMVALFSDKHVTYAETRQEKQEFLEFYEKNQENISASIAFHTNDETKPFTMQDINGREVVLGDHHAWFFDSTDGECTTIINPWNSSEKVIVRNDDLIEKAYCFDFVDFSK